MIRWTITLAIDRWFSFQSIVQRCGSDFDHWYFVRYVWCVQIICDDRKLFLHHLSFTGAWHHSSKSSGVWNVILLPLLHSADDHLQFSSIVLPSVYSRWSWTSWNLAGRHCHFPLHRICAVRIYLSVDSEQENVVEKHLVRSVSGCIHFTALSDPLSSLHPDCYGQLCRWADYQVNGYPYIDALHLSFRSNRIRGHSSPLLLLFLNHSSVGCPSQCFLLWELPTIFRRFGNLSESYVCPVWRWRSRKTFPRRWISNVISSSILLPSQ